MFCRYSFQGEGLTHSLQCSLGGTPFVVLCLGTCAQPVMQGSHQKSWYFLVIRYAHISLLGLTRRFVPHLFLLFFFWVITSHTQKLLMAVNSRITPGTAWVARNPTQEAVCKTSTLSMYCPSGSTHLFLRSLCS